MPSAFSALLEVGAPADVGAPALRWTGAEVEVHDGISQVRVRAGAEEWLLVVLAAAAGDFDVTILEPADLRERVGEVAARLGRTASRER
jgi:hypothetical protein